MTTALMAQQQFHLSARAYGILGTLLAVGSLAGALIAARRRARPRPQFVVGMAIVFGIVEIITGLAPNYLAYAAALPIMGFATLLTLTAGNASIQLGVDPRLRGRVMALYIMVLDGWYADRLADPRLDRPSHGSAMDIDRWRCGDRARSRCNRDDHAAQPAEAYAAAGSLVG